MSDHVLSPSTEKRRGRPKGAVGTPRDYLLNIWLQVEYFRERAKRKPGQQLSDSRVCELIARRGGLIWVVGGDVDAICHAIGENKDDRFRISKWRRSKFIHDGISRRLAQDENGRIIASHAIQKATSLRTRYTEACRLVDQDKAIREAWTNMLHDMLGLPRPYFNRRPFGIGSSPSIDGSVLN